MSHRAEEVAEALDWDAFSARHFPERLRNDALALGRSGVKQEQPEEMLRLGEAEATADAAIRDAQRELRDIDAEIERMPRRGLGSRFGRRRR